MKNIFLILIITKILCITQISQAQSNFWQKTTGIYGGEIIDLASGNNQDIYAGTFWNGLFYSGDNGKNWINITPLNRGTISKTTLNSKGHIFFISDKAYRSTDNGKSWEVINSQNYHSTTININSKGYIFVGALGQGLYRSTDEGKTWTLLNTGSSISNATPFFPNDIAINSKDYLFFTHNGGIRRSTDDGETWNDMISKLNFYGSRHFFTTNKNDDYFVGTEEGGVLRSTDLGKTWIQINNGLTQLYIKSISIKDNGYIFACSRDSGVFISTNNGENWVKKNNGLKDRRIVSSTVSKNGTVFVGTLSKGVFYSTDSGENWVQSNDGLTEIGIIKFIFDKKGNAYALGGNPYGVKGDDGFSCQNIFKCSINANEWIDINGNIPESIFRSICINNDDHICIGTDLGLFLSTDYGNSWQLINSGLGSSDIYSTAVDKNGNIYAGTNNGEVYFSNDNGKTWQTVFTGFTTQYIYSIAINSQGHIFINSNNDGIFRTTDKGTSWQKINSGLDYLFINDVKINSKDILYLNNMRGLYVAKNNGEKWEKVNSPSIVKFDFSDRIYACDYNKGIWFSEDEGTTWNKIADTSLNQFNITAISSDTNGILYVGTYDGVYKSTKKITNSTEITTIPQEINLYQNYPNPFNPSTVISYQLPVMSMVTLKIYNTLGQEVQTLVNEYKQRGIYSIEWKPGNLPSGVYFYRLIVEQTSPIITQRGSMPYIEIKKMILIK
jgi:photosystem II stability/assembly factor-like uncharacterized protein